MIMNYAVILSGGTGSRTGLSVPKQYYRVAGKPIIQYVLETIQSSAFIDGYVVVAAENWQSEIVEIIRSCDQAEPCGQANGSVTGQQESLRRSTFLGFASPGDNRQLSIYAGLLKLKEYAAEDDIVLIQDAARPNTTEELLRRCVSFFPEEDGSMPVLPMKDTIYRSNTGKYIDTLLRREELFAGQAPEAFRFGKYLRANEALLPDRIRDINGSSEPAVLAGMKIAMIEGDENNYKITTESDLKKFEADLTTILP
jgi:2-C-methyl-D-erythritol 4-phosphate cytidylyltransferase